MPKGATHAGMDMRLKRIEGQVRGVGRMIQEKRYCIDIIQQLTAVRRAVDEVSLKVMRGHVDHCVSQAIKGRGGSQKIEEQRTPSGVSAQMPQFHTKGSRTRASPS